MRQLGIKFFLVFYLTHPPGSIAKEELKELKELRN